jgi:negative regulator of sigma E activity
MGTELSQPDQERLSAWMDGELEPTEAEAVARRVETDAAWAEAYRRLRALDRTLGLWDVPTPPADLADRVLAHARRRPEPVVLRVGRWILSAAAVMLIGVGLWLHFAQKRTAPVGRNPTQAALAGVPESFVRDNADLFHHMPENLPAKGPYRIVLTRPAGSATQPSVRVLSWNQLTPQQQQAVRRRAVIFLRLSPEQQVKLLRAHERALREAKLHRQQQMIWLKPVIESFSPEERASLLRMTPAQRGEMFLQRRNELIQAGKLSLQELKKSQDPGTDTSPFLTSPSSPSPEP